MTMPGVSCKAVATQNNAERPCSMCPIPPMAQACGDEDILYIFSNISWTP